MGPWRTPLARTFQLDRFAEERRKIFEHDVFARLEHDPRECQRGVAVLPADLGDVVMLWGEGRWHYTVGCVCVCVRARVCFEVRNELRVHTVRNVSSALTVAARELRPPSFGKCDLERRVRGRATTAVPVIILVGAAAVLALGRRGYFLAEFFEEGSHGRAGSSSRWG